MNKRRRYKAKRRRDCARRYRELISLPLSAAEEAALDGLLDLVASVLEAYDGDGYEQATAVEGKGTTGCGEAAMAD